MTRNFRIAWNYWIHPRHWRNTLIGKQPIYCCFSYFMCNNCVDYSRYDSESVLIRTHFIVVRSFSDLSHSPTKLDCHLHIGLNLPLLVADCLLSWNYLCFLAKLHNIFSKCTLDADQYLHLHEFGLCCNFKKVCFDRHYFWIY